MIFMIVARYEKYCDDFIGAAEVRAHVWSVCPRDRCCLRRDVKQALESILVKPL